MDPTPDTPPATARFRLRLLGRFELSCGDRALSVSPAGERLLAYLGLRPEPVARSAVAAALWPGCTDTRAAANLRSALWRLHERRPAPPVCHHDGLVALAPDVTVDLSELSTQLDRSFIGEVGIATLRQDVLPDWPDEWLIATREWFRQIRLRALEALSDGHRAAGRMDAALAAGLAAVSSDPLRESAHRRLTQVHIAEGNFAEALRQYQSYRRLARAELGLPPSPQFRTLIAPLLDRPLDRVGLTGTAGPGRRRSQLAVHPQPGHGKDDHRPEKPVQPQRSHSPGGRLGTGLGAVHEPVRGQQPGAERAADEGQH
jgi:DNA-binding SARP family transcriptional activator